MRFVTIFDHTPTRAVYRGIYLSLVVIYRNRPLKCLRHASVKQWIAMQSGKQVAQNLSYWFVLERKLCDVSTSEGYSLAILIVGDHWWVKCFVLWYKFSSPVATNNTSPMIPDELQSRTQSHYCIMALATWVENTGKVGYFVTCAVVFSYSFSEKSARGHYLFKRSGDRNFTENNE